MVMPCGFVQVWMPRCGKTTSGNRAVSVAHFVHAVDYQRSRLEFAVIAQHGADRVVIAGGCLHVIGILNARLPAADFEVIDDLVRIQHCRHVTLRRSWRGARACAQTLRQYWNAAGPRQSSALWSRLRRAQRFRAWTAPANLSP